MDPLKWTPYASLQSETRSYDPPGCLGTKTAGKPCNFAIAPEAFAERKSLLDYAQENGLVTALTSLEAIIYLSLCKHHRSDFSVKLLEWKVPILEALLAEKEALVAGKEQKIKGLQQECQVLWHKQPAPLSLPMGMELVSTEIMDGWRFHLHNLGILYRHQDYANHLRKFVDEMPDTHLKELPGLPGSPRACSEAFFVDWMMKMVGQTAVAVSIKMEQD